MTRAVVLDANLLVLLVAGQTDAHLADIPQCPTRVRSPYQSGHRNRNSGKNPIGLINVTRWIGGVSLVLRAMRLPSIMPQQSARVGPLSHHPLPGKTTRNTEPYGAPGDTDNVPR
jgi:hypothetical protein